MVGVLALLAAIGIGLFIFLGVRAVRDADFTMDDSGFEPFGNGETHGDAPELDALWDRCDDGDMAACDDLFFQSPFGSEYEDFGASCGGTRPGETGLCGEGS